MLIVSYIATGIVGHWTSDAYTCLGSHSLRIIIYAVVLLLPIFLAKTLFIEPGSPWENGYIEPFNSKLRDELLNVEVFDTLFEAKVLVERWRQIDFVHDYIFLETTESGWNVIVGTNKDKIVEAAFAPLTSPALESPYGDGKAADRIIRVLKRNQEARSDYSLKTHASLSE